MQYKSRFHAVRLVCTTCPDDRYQPRATLSPQSLQGCHYHRKIVHPEDHLILYKKGTPSLPDIYYCDFLNGFYNEYKKIYCDFYHPCRCLSRNELPDCILSFDILPGLFLLFCNRLLQSNSVILRLNFTHIGKHLYLHSMYCFVLI